MIHGGPGASRPASRPFSLLSKCGFRPPSGTRNQILTKQMGPAGPRPSIYNICMASHVFHYMLYIIWCILYIPIWFSFTFLILCDFQYPDLGTRFGTGLVPIWYQIWYQSCTRCGTSLVPDLVPIWYQIWYQSGNNLVPIWYQFGTKLVPLWHRYSNNMVPDVCVGGGKCLS